ncbi:MAG: cold-shock protein [Ignavibacteriae bacterium]|nr:cold-shock protein [Ignavibacteriota bacterium]
MAERLEGSVKWFNSSKGFGFIQQSNGEDVFVHFQEIISNGFKTLNENDKVEFSLGKSSKGLHAVEVKVLK